MKNTRNRWLRIQRNGRNGYKHTSSKCIADNIQTLKQHFSVAIVKETVLFFSVKASQIL